jgi:hypothetical protein
MLKSRRMRWARNVARAGDKRCAYRGFGGGSLRERDHLENLGLDGRVIVKRVFKKWDGGVVLV